MSTCNCAITNKFYKGASYYGIKITTSTGEDYCFDLISPCKTEALSLLNQVSRCDISISHLKDIIRDFLTDKYLSAITENGLSDNL